MSAKKAAGSSYLNRFIQPDSIVPNPVNPQNFNRYSYAGNNPINHTDPTGHCWRRGANGIREWVSNSDPYCVSPEAIFDPFTVTLPTPPIRPKNASDSGSDAPTQIDWLSASNLSNAWDVKEVAPVAYFLTQVSGGKQSGRSILSGNYRLWGLNPNAHNISSRTINNAYFMDALAPGNLLLSYPIAAVTNGVDFTIGPNANKGIGKEYAASTFVDGTAGVAAAAPLVVAVMAFGSSPPGWVVGGSIALAFVAKDQFDRRGGRNAAISGAMQVIDGATSTYNLGRAIISGQDWGCTGAARFCSR